MKRSALTFALSIALGWAQAPPQTAPPSPAPSPAALPAVTPYVLQPLDDIEIRAIDIPELNAAMKIRPDGKISAPLLDDVDAAGKTTDELTRDLVAKYSEHYRSPRITVMVRSFTAQTVYVGGEVAKAGVIPLRSGLTAVQAVVEAGGLKDSASGDEVVVMHDSGAGTPKTETVNVNAVLARTGPDLVLQPSDVVYVQKSYVSVYVGGEVAKQGLVPLSGTMTILAAVFQAGGFKETAKTNSVILIRNSGKGTPLISRVKMNDALVPSAHTLLQPYDVIYVPKSRIAKMDKFIDQWVRQLSPAVLSFGFSYLLGQSISTPIF